MENDKTEYRIEWVKFFLGEWRRAEAIRNKWQSETLLDSITLAYDKWRLKEGLPDGFCMEEMLLKLQAGDFDNVERGGEA
ncbi:MAG: hypothetical protein ACXWYM_00015 [Candidatus Binatia bacterium]